MQIAKETPLKARFSSKYFYNGSQANLPLNQTTAIKKMKLI